MKLEIPEEDLPSFLAFLGIGMLHAVLVRELPADVGIWTLGKPRVWEPLQESSAVPREIIEAFQQFDELAAIQTLMPDEFEAKVRHLIDQLTGVLRDQEISWTTSWQPDSEQTASPD